MLKTNYNVQPRYHILYEIRFRKSLISSKIFQCEYAIHIQVKCNRGNVTYQLALHSKNLFFRPHKEIFIGVVCVISYVIGFSCISRVSTKGLYER
jgi:hypothetical protein